MPKPTHEISLPIFKRCEELRPEGLFWDICAQDWTDPTEGDDQISTTNATLILEAWWTRWLVEWGCLPQLSKQIIGTDFLVQAIVAGETQDYSAPTLYEALALAINAVLDEREK